MDLRMVNEEELDAAILEHTKQECVDGRIPKLYFVKSIEDDLGGWKRQDKYVCATAWCVTVTSVLLRIAASVLPSCG